VASDVITPERLPTVAPGLRQLDDSAAHAVQGANDTSRIWERMRPMVAAYMESLGDIVEKQVAYAKTYSGAAHDDYVREVHATTSSLLGQLERLSRVMASFAKSADLLARLSKFLGDTPSDKLEEMSIGELSRIVKGAARALGDD